MSSSVQTPAAVSNLLKCTLQLALDMCISLKEKESWRGTTPAVPARQIMYVWNYVCIYGDICMYGGSQGDRKLPVVSFVSFLKRLCQAPL